MGRSVQRALPGRHRVPAGRLPAACMAGVWDNLGAQVIREGTRGRPRAEQDVALGWNAVGKAEDLYRGSLGRRNGPTGPRNTLKGLGPRHRWVGFPE